MLVRFVDIDNVIGMLHSIVVVHLVEYSKGRRIVRTLCPDADPIYRCSPNSILLYCRFQKFEIYEVLHTPWLWALPLSQAVLILLLLVDIEVFGTMTIEALAR